MGEDYMFGENEIYGQKIMNIDAKNRIVLPSFTGSTSGEKMVIQREEETFNLMSQRYINLLTERYERIRMKFLKQDKSWKIYIIPF